MGVIPSLLTSPLPMAKEKALWLSQKTMHRFNQWRNMKPFCFNRGTRNGWGQWSRWSGGYCELFQPLPGVIPRAEREWIPHKRVKTRLPNGMFNRSIPNQPNWYGSCNMGKPRKTQLPPLYIVIDIDFVFKSDFMIGKKDNNKLITTKFLCLSKKINKIT